MGPLQVRRWSKVRRRVSSGPESPVRPIGSEIGQERMPMVKSTVGPMSPPWVPYRSASGPESDTARVLLQSPGYVRLGPEPFKKGCLCESPQCVL